MVFEFESWFCIPDVFLVRTGRFWCILDVFWLRTGHVSKNVRYATQKRPVHTKKHPVRNPKTSGMHQKRPVRTKKCPVYKTMTQTQKP